VISISKLLPGGEATVTPAFKVLSESSELGSSLLSWENG
jgi:hypothetical protein